MAPVIDASTPAIKQTLASATPPSNSVNPPGGSLLAVLITGGNNGASTPVSSISDSLGAHLTYLKLIAFGSSQMFDEIWVADVPAAAPGAFTVTPTLGGTPTYSTAVGVLVLTGAKAAALQVGAAITGSATAAPSATLASLVGANSLIVGSVTNWTNTTAPTVPVGQSASFSGNSYVSPDTTNNLGYWGQYLTGVNLAAGASATINDTAPSVLYGMAVAEILAAGATLPARQPFLPWMAPQGM